MKRLFVILIVVLFAITLAAAEKAPRKIIDLANNVFVKYGTDAAIVKAVKAQNGKGMALDQVKAQDEKWKKTPGVVDYMKALMESECGKHLRAIQKEKAYIAEIFVMDKLGANVAMTDKTSDYWQGDEAKFIESFKGGKGAVHISDVEFDDSAQTYVVQVSVPVKDGNTVIGAITFGVDVDKVE